MELYPPEFVGLWRSLGARFHGMEEVVGSIPTRSTKKRPINQGLTLPASELPGIVSQPSGMTTWFASVVFWGREQSGADSPRISFPWTE